MVAGERLGRLLGPGDALTKVEQELPGALRSAAALRGSLATVSDTTEPRVDVGDLAGCLEALGKTRRMCHLVQVIVPYHQSVDGIDDLEQRLPHVVFLPLTGAHASSNGAGREHHDAPARARDRGRARRSDRAPLEDHARPDEEVVLEHRGGAPGAERRHRRALSRTASIGP